MATRLVCLCIDANDAPRLARFWAAALGWKVEEESDPEIALLPTDDTPFFILVVPVSEPKTEKNRLHFDLMTESAEHYAETVDRFMALGAGPVDIGQGEDPEGVVLADPEGNEFCIGIRSSFFADTGFLGAVVFEPAEVATGYFWSAATGWPVVYDEGGDTAIRHPSGLGPFITFGPPGVPPKMAKGRIHLDVAPTADDDQATEVQRLIDAGATPADIGQRDVRWVVLADPDGNEFCVLTPR